MDSVGFHPEPPWSNNTGRSLELIQTYYCVIFGQQLSNPFDQLSDETEDFF